MINSPSDIFANSILTLDGQQVRVLEFNRDTDIAWLIAVDELDTSLPWSVPMSALKSGKIEEIKIARTGFKVSEKRRSRSDTAWTRIQKLLNSELSLFHSNTRAEAIKCVMKTHGGSFKYYYDLLRRYWKRGQCRAALAPDFQLCGRKQSKVGPTFNVTGGRGRPRKDGREIFELLGKNIDDMRGTLDKFYLRTRKPLSLKATYEQYLGIFHTAISRNDAIVDDVRPSYHQFRGVLKQYKSFDEIISARNTSSDVSREHRKITGSVEQDCHGAGDIYEIDSTPFDVQLVDRAGRVIGKPTVYFVIDRSTRLIIGWYVGLEDPSTAALCIAILSLFEDKRRVCERLEIPYEEEDWPAQGVTPTRILSDRGSEMLSDYSEQFKDIGIDVFQTVAGQSEKKACVERSFGVMSTDIAAADIPGYDPAANQMRRQKKDFTREATFQVIDLEKEIVKRIISNNKTRMPDFRRSRVMLERGIQPIPRDLWNESISNQAGYLRKTDYETARRLLLPREKVTINKTGVHLAGLTYRLPESIENDWLISARAKSFKAEVIYDSRCIDMMQIINGDKLIELKLSDIYQDYRGMSFNEFAKYKSQMDRDRSVAVEDRTERRVKANISTRATVHNAAARLEGKPRPTKTATRKSTKVDRDEARKTERTERPLLQTAGNSTLVSTVLPIRNQIGSKNKSSTPSSNKKDSVSPSTRSQQFFQISKAASSK